jgi:hypothetical protein
MPLEFVKYTEVIPEETDRFPLKEGDSFAITGIVFEQHGTGDKAYETLKINGVSLPDGADFLKFKTSSNKITEQCRNLLSVGCFSTGECKKPIAVRVEGKDTMAGRQLCLVDAL